MKAYNIYIGMLAVLLSFSSCINDWDAETVSTDEFTAENVGQPNSTITEVRSRFSAEIGGSSWGAVEEDLVIEGVVTANDISGNLYQQILIQEVKDGQVRTDVPGIMVGMKGLSNFYTIFPVGQRIRINLKGLYVGGYGKQAKIGQPYINTNGILRMGPMAWPYVKSNIQKVGTPDPSLVVAREVTAADLVSGNIDKLTPMLVVMKGVTIPDAASTDKASFSYAYTADPTVYSVEHKIKFPDGKIPSACTLYTSTSALFACEAMPKGKVDLYGMLGRYNSNFQMQLRDSRDAAGLPLPTE